MSDTNIQRFLLSNTVNIELGRHKNELKVDEHIILLDLIFCRVYNRKLMTLLSLCRINRHVHVQELDLCKRIDTDWTQFCLIHASNMVRKSMN